MPSLNLLVVGNDKELPNFEEALDGCKRYVGPIKLFTATKAVDAVSRLSKLIQTCGTCHAAFLSNHFTAPGKEEFSDTLRKVLKEKYPDVPVICWGNTKKGGEQHKHYHLALEVDKDSIDTNAIVEVLKQVQSGQVHAEYLHKGEKGRKSIDAAAPAKGSPKPAGIERTASGRMERTASGRMERSASLARAPAEAASPGGLPASGTMRRKSLEGPGLANSPSMGHSAAMGLMASPSMNAHAGMGLMGSPSMNSGMGMGMGMGLMASPSMNSGAGMGLMASPSMNNAGYGGMGMGGMGMGGMGSMPGSMNSGMTAGMAPMGMISPHGSMNAGMTSGMDPMHGMMANMSLNPGAMQQQQQQQQPVAAAAAGPAAGSAELIKMLAEEVTRLRKAVDEKRHRESAGAADLPSGAPAMQQQQPQQQQMGGMQMGGMQMGGMPMGGMQMGGMPMQQQQMMPMGGMQMGMQGGMQGMQGMPMGGMGMQGGMPMGL